MSGRLLSSPHECPPGSDEEAQSTTVPVPRSLVADLTDISADDLTADELPGTIDELADDLTELEM